MIPDKNQIEELLRKYAPNDEEYQRIYIHGQIVAEIALDCAKNLEVKVDLKILEAACLLHDIGSYVFLAAKNYDDIYENSYPQHAIFGALILDEEGVDKRICDAIKTHVLLGLTADEIKISGKRLPYKNYEPQTVEANLVCWADRFHSKKPVFNSYETFHKGMQEKLPLQAKKLEDWSKEFGIPDIDALAIKYDHPVK